MEPPRPPCIRPRSQRHHRHPVPGARPPASRLHHRRTRPRHRRRHGHLVPAPNRTPEPRSHPHPDTPVATPPRHRRHSASPHRDRAPHRRAATASTGRAHRVHTHPRHPDRALSQMLTRYPHHLHPTRDLPGNRCQRSGPIPHDHRPHRTRRHLGAPHHGSPRNRRCKPPSPPSRFP